MLSISCDFSYEILNYFHYESIRITKNSNFIQQKLNMMKKLLISLILLGFTIPATSQILPFLEKGKSGAGLTIGAEKGYGFSSFVAGVGASFGGKIDIEAASYNSGYDRDKLGLLDDKAKSKYLEFHLTWWLLKTELAPNLDLNIGVNPVFLTNDYTNYKYTDGTSIVTYDGYIGGALGIVTNMVYRTNSGWIFIPSYRFHYQAGQEKTSISLTNNSTSKSGITSSFGAAVGKTLGKAGTIYLSLKQYDDTYNTGAYYDMTVGYVIPF